MTARQPRPGRGAGIAFGATVFMIRHRFGGYLRAVPSRVLVLPPRDAPSPRPVTASAPEIEWRTSVERRGKPGAGKARRAGREGSGYTDRGRSRSKLATR